MAKPYLGRCQQGFHCGSGILQRGVWGVLVMRIGPTDKAISFICCKVQPVLEGAADLPDGHKLVWGCESSR